MINELEDCPHGLIFDRWFDPDHVRLDDEMLYWGETKQREIKLLREILGPQQRLRHLSRHKATRPQWLRSSTEELFNQLADTWRDETAHLSSLTKKITHPAYLRVISLGPTVVPLVLRRLKSEPAYWFEALRALTGQDPVPVEAAANFKAGREAWLTWGRTKGLI